ncbi:TPA: hypothetical protein ACGY8F_002736 [Stenotrophomonas maltophilia]
MFNTHEDEIEMDLNWLKKQDSCPLAVELTAKIEAIDLEKLELPRRRLLVGFVHVLADEVKAMLDLSAKDYDSNEIARMTDVIGGTTLARACQAPITKRQPGEDLRDKIAEETSKVTLASEQTGAGHTARLMAKWAKSAASDISKNESFGSWHLLLLCYAHFLICMESRCSRKSSSPPTADLRARLNACLDLMRQLHRKSDAIEADEASIEAELAYENQMLGGFVFQLGYASGAAGTPVPVNMFQQTPNDGCFGDLVAGNARCLAIEFKREAKSIQTEAEKWTSEALASLINETNLVSLSLKCHLLCYGNADGQTMSFSSMLYATAIGASEEVVEMSGDEIIACILGKAVNGELLKNSTMGLPPRQLERYLRSLAHIRDSSKGGGKATWLALAIDEKGFHFRIAATLSALIEPTTAPGAKVSAGMTRG